MRRDHVISLMWMRPSTPGLQFHEGAVIGDVDHPADHAAVHGIALRNRLPGVGLQLLDAQRDALLGAVELEHLDGDFVAHVQHLRRMRDAPVGHVGDVQKAVDAAQIDEGAVIGQVLDHARDHRAFCQVFEGDGLADVDLFLDRHLARHHHVAAAAVELDDLDRDVLADQGIQVVHRARIGLRTRHERLDADIHRQPAFDAAQHAAGEDQLLVVGLLEVVPDPQARCARVREQDVAFHGARRLLDHHVDDVAGLHGNFAGWALKLLDRHDAFGFVAEIDDDFFGGDAQNGTLQDFIGGGRGEVAVIFEKILVVFGNRLVHLPIVLVYGHQASATH